MHDSPPLFANVNGVHLYLAHGCPFCHRIVAALSLTGLSEKFSITWMKNIKGISGWEIETSHDPVFGASSLAEVYRKVSSKEAQRKSVPLLVDKQTKQFVSNSSADIVRLISTGFQEELKVHNNLFPKKLRYQINQFNDWLHENVNRAVYLVGFSNNQADYEGRVCHLFESLDWLERHLKNRRYVIGERLTESDIYLLATLMRFDSVYFTLFKCSIKRLADYPALTCYLKHMLSEHDLSHTYDDQTTREHYFLSSMHVNGEVRDLNPSRLIPVRYAN